jgi:hypothetical protein
LEVEDLPIALRWVARYPASASSPLSIERLIDKIFAKAWIHLDDTSIAETFALAVLPRLRARHTLISLVGFDDESDRLKDLLNNDHARRHLLLLALLSVLPDDDGSATTLLLSRMVRTSDVPWLLDQLRSSAPATQPILAKMIKFVFDWTDPVQFEIVFEEARLTDALNKEIGGFGGP